MNQTRPTLQADGPLIVIENVTRTFQVGDQTIRALRDVSFTVGTGEFVAIIGRSGSGKTTLLNVIAGLDRPTSGRVVVDGLEVSAMDESQLTELRRHKLGFVFQSFGLLPLLSAFENVELALRIAGAGVRDRARRTAEVLELVGLTRRGKHRPYELSGGEQQRVAIARALANKPAIILADEPTGELDSMTATSIFTLLVEIVAREKVTVVTTTHDRLVMDRAQRIIELSDGALVEPGSKIAEPTGRQEESAHQPAPPRATPSRRQVPAMPDDTDGRERWARPEQIDRPLYQPPGPPRAPL